MSQHNSYNFGVEIEAFLRPYADGFDWSSAQWYAQLAQRLRNRGVRAVADDLRGQYRKHPEYYGESWFLTKDGSIRPPAGVSGKYVTMEAVSPVLNTTTSHVSNILAEFWEAMSVHFSVIRSSSCGGHVHITPPRTDGKFTLNELKTVAFATLFYEDFVFSILPHERVNNQYCVRNSHSSAALRQSFTGSGPSSSSFTQIRQRISQTSTPQELHSLMQGTRHVLWNFENTVPAGRSGRCSGTVEFRGGNQFLGEEDCLRWIAFVVGFVSLALREDLLMAGNIQYIPTNSSAYQEQLNEWWQRITQETIKYDMRHHLPRNHAEMKGSIA